MPETVPTSFYAGFLAFVAVMLALDLGVFHRKAHAPSFRESLAWVATWTTLALSFGGFVGWRFGSDAALDYYAAWLIEQSLSIDNIFVFVLVFSSLQVPRHLQHRVLYWGILSAVVLRAVMIFGGLALIERFQWVLYVFGAFLLFTGLKLLLRRDHGEVVHPDVPPPDLAHAGASGTAAAPSAATSAAVADGAVAPNVDAADLRREGRMLRFVRRLIPTVGLHEQKFFVRVDGKLKATTLFLALVLVELTDVMFAVDSIPAVFGVTTVPFLVFTSNIFAILGLRSLYFVLAGMHDRFRYLEPGLGIVLGFVGAKLLLHDVLHVPTWLSLTVIVLVLGGAVGLSLLQARWNAERLRS